MKYPCLFLFLEGLWMVNVYASSLQKPPYRNEENNLQNNGMLVIHIFSWRWHQLQKECDGDTIQQGAKWQPTSSCEVVCQAIVGRALRI